MKVSKFIKIASLSSIVVGCLSFAAIAQYNNIAKPPLLANVTPQDLFQDIPGGNVSVGNFYVTAAQIAGVPGYTKSVPLTAFSLTFTNTQTDLILNPAGTLATGTITAAPMPSDGQRECVLSTQIVTALTWNANAGQTINNAPTALAANVPVCFTYSAANLTWDRSP